MSQKVQKSDQFEHSNLTGQVLNAAYKVHTALGAGLLESCYESCMVYELRKRGFNIRQQVIVPIIYDCIEMDKHFKIDLVIEERLVLEIKAVEAITPLHFAQVLTYLKLFNMELGLILNFNTVHLKDGIRRVDNTNFS